MPVPVSDSADWMDREPPRYEDDDGKKRTPRANPIRLRTVAERDAAMQELFDTTEYVTESGEPYVPTRFEPDEEEDE